MVNKTQQVPARRLPKTKKPAPRKVKADYGSPDHKQQQQPENEEDSTSATVKKVKSSSAQRRWMYKCSFNGLCKFFNTHFEKDEESRKKDKTKVWFIELQLKKLMDSPFWNVLKIFINEEIKLKHWARTNDAVVEMVTKYSVAYGKEHAFCFYDSNNNPVVVKSTSEILAVIFGLKKKKIVYSESDTDDELEMPSELINRLQAFNPERTEKSQLYKADIEDFILSIMRAEGEKQTEKDAEDLVMLLRFTCA